MIYAKTAKQKYVSVLQSIPEEPSTFVLLRQLFVYHYEYIQPIPRHMKYIHAEPKIIYDFDCDLNFDVKFCTLM